MKSNFPPSESMGLKKEEIQASAFIFGPDFDQRYITLLPLGIDLV